MKRIKLLCVVLLVIFLAVYTRGAVLPFRMGLNTGFDRFQYETNSEKSTDDFLLMDVVAKDANYMESTELNEKTGTPF